MTFWHKFGKNGGALPVVVLFVFMVFLHAKGSALAFESPLLLAWLNTVCLGAIPLVIAYLAARSYRATGVLAFLLMGCGLIFFGVSSLYAGWVMPLAGGPNPTVTLHNLGSLLAGVCQVAAAHFFLHEVMGTMASIPHARRSEIYYAVIVILISAVAVLTFQGRLPLFFDPLTGPSGLRQVVLGSAIGLSAVAGLIFLEIYATTQTAFAYWYGLALWLITVGLACVYLQPSVGSMLGWTGRGAQYLGTLYIILAFWQGQRELPATEKLPRLLWPYLEQKVGERTTALTRLNETLHQEIAARLQAEEQLRRQATWLQFISDAVIITDLDLVITGWNEAATHIYGWSANETIGCEIDELLGTEFITITHAEAQAVLRQTGLWSGQLRQHTKTGKPLYIEASMTFLRDDAGTIIGGITINRDISARVQAEKALRLQYDLSLALSSTIDLRQGLAAILDTVLQLESIDCGGIYIADTASGALDLMVQRGLTPQFASRVSHYAADSPQVHLARMGEVQYRNYADISSLPDDIPQQEGLHALATIPVLHHGQLLAVLNLASHTGDAIPTSTRTAGESLALQIGSTLMRLRIETALRESLQTSDDLVQAIPSGLFIYQFAPPDQLFLLGGNPAAERLTGINIKEWQGREFNELWPNARATGITAAYLRVINTGKTFETEDIYYQDERLTGEFRVRVFCLPGDRLAVAFENITAHKQAEEQIKTSLREKEVMLQEIHHRVKNNLQVISSLLDMQTDLVDDSQTLQILQDSQNRVRSMAMVHEKLYQSTDLTRIDMAEYIEDMVSYLLIVYSDRAIYITPRLTVEEVLLGIDKAIPCGLIINELVSNALKYAFSLPLVGERPSPEPEIRVSFASSEGEYTLIVSDNGVGLPPELDIVDIDTTSSLGLRLVNILTNQLQGTLEIEHNHGTTLKLTFPKNQQKKSRSYFL